MFERLGNWDSRGFDEGLGLMVVIINYAYHRIKLFGMYFNANEWNHSSLHIYRSECNAVNEIKLVFFTQKWDLSLVSLFSVYITLSSLWTALCSTQACSSSTIVAFLWYFRLKVYPHTRSPMTPFKARAHCSPRARFEQCNSVIVVYVCGTLNVTTRSYHTELIGLVLVDPPFSRCSI